MEELEPYFTLFAAGLYDGHPLIAQAEDRGFSIIQTDGDLGDEGATAKIMGEIWFEDRDDPIAKYRGVSAFDDPEEQSIVFTHAIRQVELALYHELRSVLSRDDRVEWLTI